jgi:predicted amidohydrolase YtcJ
MTADLVLAGGTIWTGRAGTGIPERHPAVAISGGRVALVGDRRDVRPLIGRKTEVIDTRGQLVLPGFCDAHVHPVIAGMQLLRCDLTEATSREDCLALVRGYAQANAGAAIITGGGGGPRVFSRRPPAPERA